MEKGVGIDEDGRGQSAIIGVVILLGLSLFAGAAVVVLGGTALTDTQQQSELGQAEHSMTQFDSLVAQVALGDSDTQSLSFGGSGGNYHVDPTAGRVQIVHVNHSGSGNSEVIYEQDLGTVIYENKRQTVAYQGGGVWRKGESGQGRMVSPPEFHYRGATLTFPVVRVNQGGQTASGSGSTTVNIEKDGASTDVFPDGGKSYSATSKKYLNPAENGSVFADIESEYYEGWANYFRTRTEGEVTTFDGNQTVRVELISTGQIGDFPMPEQEGSIEVRGVSNHSMTDFSIRLVDDQNDSADMANLKWSMYVEDGDRQLELYLEQSGGSKCPGTLDIKSVVYYSPADGDSDRDDPYHGWMNDTAYETFCQDVDGDGDDETILEVDYVDDEDNNKNVSEIEAGDPIHTYTSLANDDIIKFGNPNDNLLLEATTSPKMEFGGHGVHWEPRSYDDETGDATHPSEESIDRIINHYFSVMGPGFDLTVHDKDSNTVEESLSSGTIFYEGGGKFVTYMHITENKVVVSLD